MNRIHLRVLVPLVACLFEAQLTADYFDDPGNRMGLFRTDYASPNAGTAEFPLELDQAGFYYGQQEFGTELLIEVHASEACPAGPGIYPGGPFYHANVPDEAASFWVISANVEAFAFGNGNTPGPLGELQGPPNLSTSLTGFPDLLRMEMLPRNAGPDSRLMLKEGTASLFEKRGKASPRAADKAGPGNSGDQGYEAHLVIDNMGLNGEPKFPDAIPFLGLGAENGWGNNGPVGWMNEATAPHTTYWVSRLYEANVGRPEDAMSHNVVANAEWGGKRRMIQLLLYHHNLESSTLEIPGIHRHWNWPATGSFWYPGADIAFIDVEDIPGHCGEGAGLVPQITKIGRSHEFLLDWQFLFRCLSDHGLFDDPMPHDEPVPLQGVHWVVELYGAASIRAVVSEMEMVL